MDLVGPIMVFPFQKEVNKKSGVLWKFHISHLYQLCSVSTVITKGQRKTSGCGVGRRILLGKILSFYTNSACAQKKYEFHQENQKSYALDPDQELSQMSLKLLHSSLLQFFFFLMMLFLVTVKMKRLCCFLQLYQKGNSLCLWGTLRLLLSCMFLIPQSEDSEI